MFLEVFGNMVAFLTYDASYTIIFLRSSKKRGVLMVREKSREEVAKCVADVRETDDSVSIILRIEKPISLMGGSRAGKTFQLPTDASKFLISATRNNLLIRTEILDLVIHASDLEGAKTTLDPKAHSTSIGEGSALVLHGDGVMKVYRPKKKASR